MASKAQGTLEESSRLLSGEDAKVYKGEMEPGMKASVPTEGVIAEGVPIQYTSMHGVPHAPAPVQRQQWRTGLFDCINNADEWRSTDAEICVLGTFAPCVLFASNKERLAPEEDNQFSNSCCLYFGLCAAGKILLKGNWIAPFFTYPSRTQLREKYSLQSDAELFHASTGCVPVTTEEGRQKTDHCFDCLTHYFCHPCALCQEARELRRRTPHPVAVHAPMAPPAPQVMPAPAKVLA